MPSTHPPHAWPVVWPASWLVYLPTLVLFGCLWGTTTGSTQSGWAWLFVYGLLLGWPVALGLLVSLHVLVEWRFQRRAYTLGWACFYGPAAVALDVLLLGLGQVFFGAKAYLEGEYQPPIPPDTTSQDLSLLAATGALLLFVVGAGLLLALPHYFFYRRASRRA